MLACQKVLGKQFTWPVTWLGGLSQGERKVLPSSCKKKDICRLELREIRKRKGERMPVIGVLGGGGGGRLQRSSSVGRGDEGRALTPLQPPRRAHSFR